MVSISNVNKFFYEYFHPETLWEKGTIGKLEAIGSVISWATVVIPIIMAVGLAISEHYLTGRVNENKPGPVKETHKLGTNHLGRNSMPPADIQNPATHKPLQSAKVSNEKGDSPSIVSKSGVTRYSDVEFLNARFAIHEKAFGLLEAFNDHTFSEKKIERNQYDKAQSAYMNIIIEKRYINSPYSIVQSLWDTRRSAWYAKFNLDTERTRKNLEQISESVLAYRNIPDDVRKLDEVDKHLDQVLFTKMPPFSYEVSWSELVNVHPDFTEVKFNDLMRDFRAKFDY